MRSIVSGTDRIGITDEVDWTGGGGFQYFNLAPSLLEKDRYGNWIISSDYKPEMLAEALCKHMGFTYAPSQNPDEYWNHGYSTETDFIYVTTQNLTHQALSRIAEDVGPDRSLLICCKAFNANADAFENLTIKKIPHAVLRKCEWGKDDYSLNVANLPMASETEEEHQSVPTDDLPLFADNSTEGEQ
jgi:adenine-specific DNA-methyltransferase